MFVLSSLLLLSFFKAIIWESPRQNPNNLYRKCENVFVCVSENKYRDTVLTIRLRPHYGLQKVHTSPLLSNSVTTFILAHRNKYIVGAVARVKIEKSNKK